MATRFTGITSVDVSREPCVAPERRTRAVTAGE
jgi:hypothetical protein